MSPFTPRERGALAIAQMEALRPGFMWESHETPWGKLTPGDEVELVACDDPYTRIKPGTRGIVIEVDVNDPIDPGKTWVQWDDGSRLAMVPTAGDTIRVTNPIQ